MELEIYVVDAFTKQQFKGNSAAVIPISQWLDDELMQRIAAENNLSETAFIKRLATNHYEIRWFSPLTEIDFCGHATLAASSVLFNHLDCDGELSFSTNKVGCLTVKQLADKRIQMSFPNQAPQPINKVPEALLAGLSITPQTVLKNDQAYFAVMASADEVVAVEAQSAILKSLAPHDVVVTANDDKFDFVSRYFWPANGGDEDPVTGSIHAGLAPYWAGELAKNELVARQASSRGGILYCQLEDDRVLVSGYGVLYLFGKIYV
ncbi:PhzF family phenazine biosynthesis protein [Shewanella sp. 10N.286.48.A6]|uniref:PhzF family phenazine biosynthesis protein n=1 Tax=Shewanella sp. 10N.286.48.A6 TaxID=1880833 RepID=UPI000C82683E|nr:PhzF family phenazine biosynthesis protein [Shewanella sp. 10N.286.48.A6]PMH99616.1 phenazine biosynthesis protein PhzF [Shewanella sp. 10N.286.48.A6]